MSAYTALVSLRQILVTILYLQPRTIRYGSQLLNLIGEVDLLLDFLDISSTYEESAQLSELETKIRDAAHRAEDLFEYGILNQGLRNPDNILVLIISFYILAPLPARLEVLPVWVPIIPVEVVICTIHALLLYLEIRHKFSLLPINASQESRRILYDFKIVVKEVNQFKEARGEAEMSAREALISLRQILDSFLHSGGGLGLSLNREHLKSLQVMVCFLLDILGNASITYMPTLHNLDATIRDAVYKAKRTLIEIQLPRKSFLEFDWRHLCTLYSVLFLIVPYVFFMMFRLAYYIMGNYLYFLHKPSEIIMPTWFEILEQMRISSVSYMISAAIVFIVLVAENNSGAPENQELPNLVDDFNIIVRHVIKIGDACGNPSDLPPPAAAAVAAAASRHDLGGIDNDVVVGLDSDLEQIMARLLQDSSKRELTSIVGMGGIGKTTLARQVYKDPNIVTHFDIRAWVTVSQEYSLRHVLLCLLRSAQILTEEEKYQDSEDTLALCLHKYLMYRRYLIVMDDVWDIEVWDFLSRFFPENHNGSRVLLTSRLPNVASCLDSGSNLHHMQWLNDSDSWDLLRRKVFGAEDCPLELESVGREIAWNCGGLPLAIVVIGGLLYKEVQIQVWRDVAKKLKRSELQDIKEHCLEILSLSYNHLPRHLRSCFLYMGVFLGHSEIPIFKLINLWIAEGLLRPCQSKTLEEVAEDYLNGFIDRNLVLVSKRSSNGKIRTCSMHDLLRDVCVENARKEKFRHVVEAGGYLITRERTDESPRSLSIHPNALQVDDLHDYICFVHLRVLNVIEIHFGEFPHQITDLVRLRYLAFHYDGSLPLPPTIMKLQYLETIVLHHSSFGKYSFLPSVIWKMPNLRHIYVKPGCCLFKPLDYQIFSNYYLLVNLQTLVGIRNFRWTKGIIRKIPNLKKLGILYDVSSFTCRSEYQLEKLVFLHQLENLKLIAKYDDLGSVIPKIAFPQKLRKLSLSGCRIPWESMTAIGALPNLEALKLRREAFCGSSWKTVEGEFPRLIFLLLEEVSLKKWKTKAAHFPRLQHLVIRSCPMLKKIPCSIGDIPSLEMIELVDCPLAVTSAKGIQEEQESMGNEILKFHIEERRREVGGMNWDATGAGPGIFQVLSDVIDSSGNDLLASALMAMFVLLSVLGIVLMSV